MSKRWLLLPLLVVALLAASFSAALAAYGPLWSQPVSSAARLVAGETGATVVWAAADGAGAALMAQRYDGAGEPLGAAPTVLVGGISGLGDWFAAGDGADGVVVAWKAGGTTSVRRVFAGGSAAYGPVVICSDAAVAALRGPGATAGPVQIAADGFGGVYVGLQATPSLASGDTLLAYVSPLGAASRPDPGLAVTGGTVAGMAGDSIGHLFVVLGGPGRNSLAAQRFAPSLDTDWAEPVSPYNPVFSPPPSGTQTPLGVVATGSALIAWREGGKSKAQRFSSTGDRIWLRPVAVGTSAASALSDDGWGGCYVAGPSGDGLRVWHVSDRGVAVGDAGGSLFRLGLSSPQIAGVSSDRAGDLAVAYDGGGTGGVARMTYLGAWTRATLAPVPADVEALGGDGTGGAYALGAGAGARLWRLGEGAAAALTFRPRAVTIAYGEKAGVAGYFTLAGSPLAGRSVEIRRTDRQGVTRTAVTSTTDAEGFYQAVIAPEATAVWTAAAAGPAGETIVSDKHRGPKVVPEVSIALSNRRAGSGYVEMFTGEVEPTHAGSRVLVQRRTGGSWRTITSGKLNGRSRYSASWPLPLRTATYQFRTLLPAHADHEAGVSRTATLRVVIKAPRQSTVRVSIRQ